MLARKRPSPGAGGLNHQQQGYMEKTDMSIALELTGIFIQWVCGKKGASCFEFTLAIDKGGWGSEVETVLG